MSALKKIALAVLLVLQMPTSAGAQRPPSPAQIATYDGLHKAAFEGDLEALKRLILAGSDLEVRDGNGRTPLHVVAYASHEKAVQLLIEAGADANAFDNQKYDIVTIAAVANDLEVLKLALDLGASPSNITSPYEGTALIAAAHLGHHEVVKILTDAGAPPDHINNLNWTALMESVVLGDGGADHLKTARHLLDAGANKNIPDRDGVTPYEHAVNRGYTEMIDLLKQ
ncbi:MAG: ankyrin repeat domain-containing protein [Rhizobiaceae bacterium]|nr:ankyrin repeat domain-containing protein [Rhizobiaceae bacterium]